jgi:hypothetical protein
MISRTRRHIAQKRGHQSSFSTVGCASVRAYSPKLEVVATFLRDVSVVRAPRYAPLNASKVRSQGRAILYPGLLPLGAELACGSIAGASRECAA